MAAVTQATDTTVAPAAVYASHKRQFDRFVHLLKWFAIHVLLMLPGLYFLAIASQPVTGMLFVALGLAALGYGIISTPSVARDAARAIAHEPDKS